MSLHYLGNQDPSPDPKYDSTRIIDCHEVMNRTGLSRTTLWRLEREGAFPPRRQITPNRIGWIENEIEQWLRSRPLGLTKNGKGSG